VLAAGSEPVLRAVFARLTASPPGSPDRSWRLAGGAPRGLRRKSRRYQSCRPPRVGCPSSQHRAQTTCGWLAYHSASTGLSMCGQVAFRGGGTAFSMVRSASVPLGVPLRVRESTRSISASSASVPVFRSGGAACRSAFRRPTGRNGGTHGGMLSSHCRSPSSAAFFLCRSTVARPMPRRSRTCETVQPSFNNAATFLVTHSSIPAIVQVRLPSGAATSSALKGSASFP